MHKNLYSSSFCVYSQMFILLCAVVFIKPTFLIELVFVFLICITDKKYGVNIFIILVLQDKQEDCESQLVNLLIAFSLMFEVSVNEQTIFTL